MRPVCHRTRLPARRTYPSTASGRCSTRRRIHCLTWSDAEKMADSEVYRRPIPNKTPAVPVYPNPDWDRVCREFAKTDVTLKLLRSENAKAAAARASPRCPTTASTSTTASSPTGAASSAAWGTRPGETWRPTGRRPRWRSWAP